MSPPRCREDAEALDARDPVATYRDRFLLPEGLIYLDGNSLGPPPRRTIERVIQLLNEEWGRGLVRSWTECGWIDLADRVADTIAPLVGAAQGTIAVADSISVNLFKLLAAALGLRPGRRVILSEKQNFPTDLYIAQGLSEVLGGGTSLELVDRDDLERSLGPEVAVLMLTHVDFRSGEVHDMARWTEAAHRAGALMLWDLAHSAGALPVALAACDVDLAVGCGYKYLNGGPGAPAFAYVARRHHAKLGTPLWGWMGHAEPFGFSSRYRPAPGVGRLRVGTPPILSLAALECGVALINEIGVERLRAKSIELTETFIERLERACPSHGFELISPRDGARRGSQVSLRHPEGYAIVQALAAVGVVADFRAPDIVRFGFAPAYLRHVDVWDAVSQLREIMETAAWDRENYRVRARVT